MDLTKHIDTYSIQARLYPALLTLLPIFILLIALLPSLEKRLSQVIPLLVSCGVLFLFTHIVRKRGRSVEAKLFQEWGGMPSNILLRHSDKSLDINTKTRFKEKLAKLPNIEFPTEHEEKDNPIAADDAYGSAGRWLRANTRDTSKYSILHKENIGYGFRRNLYGAKPMGIVISATALMVSIIAALFVGSVSTVAATLSATFSLLCLILWLVIVRSRWVKDAAITYANQLLSSLDIA